MYCTTGAGQKLFASWLLPTLGFWHIYKQASLQVYRAAAPHFIGPLFHHFYPKRKFLAKPRLLQITNWLSLLRLSYPAWSGDLARAGQGPTQHKIDKKHISNLRILMEYMIPVVCIHLSASFAVSIFRV
jgi:hypothetical protein